MLAEKMTTDNIMAKRVRRLSVILKLSSKIRERRKRQMRLCSVALFRARKDFLAYVQNTVTLELATNN
jgi:hypothetical protein